MNITYDELYTGWVNYEKELMRQHNFKENNVYKQKTSKNHDYAPDFRDVLFAFWDWQSRQIPIQPYIVHESREIKKTLIDLDDEQKNAYEEIKNKFIAGDTLHSYQRHLDKPLYQKSYSYRHWGIEHLHLGKLINNQKKVTPCKHILFISISDNNVYFIDITEHEDFHDERLLKIIDDNWPSQLLTTIPFLTSSDTSNIEPNIIKKVRQKNWNIISTINGKTVWPLGHGINGAGGGVASIQKYNTSLYTLETLQYIINNNLCNIEMPNKILYTIPIGYRSGGVIFDSFLQKDGFMLLYKAKRDYEYIDIFIQQKLQLQNISSDAKENLIKTIRCNDSILCYISGGNLDKIYWTALSE